MPGDAHERIEAMRTHLAARRPTPDGPRTLADARARIAALEERIARLEAELAELRGTDDPGGAGA